MMSKDSDIAGKNLEPKGLWEEVGIHRALGGVWYRSVIQLVALIFLFVVGAIIVPSLAPYPSVQGYRGVVSQMMALTFTIFDVGIGSSLIRYVSEYRVRDLPRALQYASFFIWFQAFTGVVQITAIAYWGLVFLPSTNIGYTVWFIITYSVIQWPSSTGIFRDLLKSFQHHDKAQLIEIIQNALLEVVTQVTFILIFREWGRQHPQYGELMGITIGWILGVMMDDVIAMIIAGHWFSKILREVSGNAYSVIDVIRPHFTKEVVKDSLTFGLQNMGASLLDALKGTLLVWIWIEFLPSYAFFVGIVSLVGSLVMKSGGELNTGIIPAITESYNNGKERLTKYYFAEGFKWIFFFIVFIDVLNFAVFPYILGAVLEVTGTYFLLAVVAIPVQVIVWNFDPLNDFLRDIIRNTGHVTLYVGITAVTVCIDLVTAILLIGHSGMGWFILILFPLPGKIFVLAFSMIFVKKRVIDYEIPLWQSFGAHGLSGIFYFLFSMFFTSYIAPFFIDIDPLGGAIILLAISFLLIPMFIYVPLYTLFGGLDAQGLVDFRKAMLLSGPSKFLIRPSYKIAEWIARKNPFKLHNKYPVPTTGVVEDIQDLMNMKSKSVSAKDPLGED